MCSSAGLVVAGAVVRGGADEQRRWQLNQLGWFIEVPLVLESEFVVAQVDAAPGGHWR